MSWATGDSASYSYSAAFISGGGGGWNSFLKKLMGSEIGSGTLVSVESKWVRGGPTAKQASQPHLQETKTVTYPSLPLLPLTVSESSCGKNQV